MFACKKSQNSCCKLKQMLCCAGCRNAFECGEFACPQGPRGEKGDPGPIGPEGPQGIPGENGVSTIIKGSYDTLAELESAHPGGSPGDAYLVDGNLYTWSENDKSWKDMGSLRGPAGTIIRAFVNGTIGEQTIESNDTVKFSAQQMTASGIAFNGTDTFTIQTQGVYALTVTLNYAVGTAAGSIFGLAVTGDVPPVAPAVNAGTQGPVSIIRAAHYKAGDSIKVVNYSPNAVKISNAPGTIMSAGHVAIHRVSD